MTGVRKYVLCDASCSKGPGEDFRKKEREAFKCKTWRWFEGSTCICLCTESVEQVLADSTCRSAHVPV